MRRSRWIISAIIFVFCLFIMGEKAFAEVRENKDYCQSAGRIVILLVDITTPYDQTDKTAIERMTDDMLSSISGGDKLVIHTIADSHTHSERLIERCIPQCAAVGRLGKFFNCSDGAIKTDFDNVRADVINSLRQRLLKFEELKYSDIIQTIFSIANEDAREGQGLSLHIYSDLIENSDYLPSKWLFQKDYPVSRLIAGLRIYKRMANLKDADIHVAGVGRADTRERRPLTVGQLNKLTEFWTTYFHECGAKSVKITQNATQ